MKKKTNILSRIFAFTCVLVLLMSFTTMPVFANSDYDDGLLNPEDLPIWNADTGNTVMDLGGYDYMNEETLLAIFQYWDFAYQHNMTNGCKLIGCTISKYGSGTSSPAPNKTAIMLYFASPDKNYAYGVKNGYALNIYDWQSDTATAGTVGYVQCIQLNYGNYEFYTKSDATSISNFCSTAAYAYRNIDGRIITYESNAATAVGVFPGIVNARIALEEYVLGESSGSGGASNVVHEYTIDLASMFTAIMNAPRQIFDGAFGFTLFGINIASTLISILIVAIVLWIIKHWLGGD